jgi:hypothetical protein
MAETDILNPVPGFWTELGDSPTWNYDWTRKKAINKQDMQSRLGSPYSRDIGNAGHSFAWNWVARPLATMQRLMWFYENFKHGYFTVIDYDNGGRHYVGRFMAPPFPQQTANLTYTAQAVAFQEVPRARMLQYPNDWANDGFTIYALDDFLNPRVYATPGTFVAQQTPAAVLAGTSVNAPSSYEMLYACGDDVPANFAQAQYVGFGFQMEFRLGANLGALDLYLDGVKIISSLSLYNGAAIATGPTVTAGAPPVVLTVTGGAGVGSVLVTVTNVPLDQHRVKVVALGTKTFASTGYSVIFPPLQGMY